MFHYVHTIHYIHSLKFILHKLKQIIKTTIKNITRGSLEHSLENFFKVACTVQIWKKKHFVKTVKILVTVLFQMTLYTLHL